MFNILLTFLRVITRNAVFFFLVCMINLNYALFQEKGRSTTSSQMEKKWQKSMT